MTLEFGNFFLHNDISMKVDVEELSIMDKNKIHWTEVEKKNNWQDQKNMFQVA